MRMEAPPLSSLGVTCPLCGSRSVERDRSTVLRSQECVLRSCESCGSAWLHQPSWLEAAYQNSITNSDVGLVARNLSLRRLITWYLRLAYPFNRRLIIDWGAGTGLMVRLLRDAGYDAKYYDLHGGNQFAAGFELPEDSPPGALILALEVVEHSENPIDLFSKATQQADDFLFTTDIIPDPVPGLMNWEYYGLEHGQHVMFYSRKGLQCVADTLGFQYVSVRNTHLFTRSAWRARVFTIVSKSHYLSHVLRFRTRRSLLGRDAQFARST
jgi:hypothetical protein